VTDQQTPMPRTTANHRRGRADPASSHAAERSNGWIRFGGILMVVGGAFAVIEGVLALVAPTTYILSRGGVAGVGLPVWGWLHVVLGILVLATGAGLLRRETPGWARAAGTALVAIDIVVQLAWLPASPIWSIIVITLDVFVLYALFVAWDGVRD
jgi:hypothetical protein